MGGKEIKWNNNTKQQPEKSGRYIISIDGGLVDCDYYSKWSKDLNLYSKHEIIAWMCLPEPYEPEKEENK